MQINLSEALNLFKKGELLKAKNICEEILKKDNNNSEVHNLHGFILYLDKNFDEAIASWKKAININSNYIEAYNGLGNVFLKLNKLDLAIQNFEKAVKINPNYFEAYCNLGSAMIRLEKYQDAIDNFEKAIKIKPNYSQAMYGKAYSLMKNRNYSDAIIYFNKFTKYNPQNADAFNAIGSCLISLNKFKDSLNYLIKATDLQPEHKDAQKNLMNLLKFYQPIEDYPNLTITINKKIRSKKFEVNLKNQIIDQKIINYYRKIYEILKEFSSINNFNEEQIFRRNELILNCDRHFQVFNTFNVIPEYCFGCYKIQIDLKNILELFKLHFIFDNLVFERNNIRKTMIETRANVKGTYKGLIYCSGLDEAKKISNIIEPIIKFNIDKKIKFFIKRGCTEFNLSYPGFDKTDQSVKYNNDWKDKEKKIDDNYKFEEDTTLKNSISGLNISDALVMKNWLIYAKKINDLTYKKFSIDISANDYMEKKMFNQVEFRRNEFSKTK